MVNETIITVVGNLVADPDLRYTQSGLAVVNMTIASTPRVFDKQTNQYRDGDALFLRASAWRDFAEAIAANLKKGQRVVAQGRLSQKSYQTKEGDNRTYVELEVDEIGPSLRFAKVNGGRVGQQQPSSQGDQWPTPSTHGETWSSPAADADTPF